MDENDDLVFGFIGERYVCGFMNQEPLYGLPSGMFYDYVLE